MTANLLLCDVLSGLSKKALLLPYGDRPIVRVFGVEMVLGPAYPLESLNGTLEAGQLYRLLETPAGLDPNKGKRVAVAGREPTLFIRRGRLLDARGVDLGDALEEVEFVLCGPSRAAGGRASSSVAAARRVRELAGVSRPDTPAG